MVMYGIKRTTALYFVNMYRCVKCGAPVDANRYRCSEEMTQKCLCFDCNFWTEHVQRDRNENKDVFVVANGKHYIIDESPNPYFKGYGGAKWTIRFNDGRVVKTDNLWFQGLIPELFRDKLPDNAVLIDGWED